MSKAILLVEDNPSDEKLTLRAFKRSNVENEIVVARDGAEALDYLLGEPSEGAPRGGPARFELTSSQLPRGPPPGASRRAYETSARRDLDWVKGGRRSARWLHARRKRLRAETCRLCRIRRGG